MIFRLVNVLLHVTNAFLFTKTLDLLRPKATSSERFLIFSLFLFHPVALVTINWIFQLKTLLCMTFTLLTLNSFERCAREERPVLNMRLVPVVLLSSLLIARSLLFSFPFTCFLGPRDFKSKKSFIPLTSLPFFLELFLWSY